MVSTRNSFDWATDSVIGKGITKYGSESIGTKILCDLVCEQEWALAKRYNSNIGHTLARNFRLILRSQI